MWGYIQQVTPIQQFAKERDLRLWNSLRGTSSYRVLMRNKAKKIGDVTPSYPLLELIPPHKNRALRDHGLHPYHVSCVNTEKFKKCSRN